MKKYFGIYMLCLTGKEIGTNVTLASGKDGEISLKGNCLRQ